MSSYQKDNIRKLHLYLAHSRGSTKTYCPSEIARLFSNENWRNHMSLVREVADELVSEEILEVMQKNKIILSKPSETKGPIRLKLK